MLQELYKREHKTPENKEEGNEQKDTGAGDLYQAIESEPLTDLLEYIRTDIVPCKKVVLMTSLTSKLEWFMLSSGIERMTDSISKRVCRRLESELGRSIDVFTDNKGKWLVVPESVLLKMLSLKIKLCRESSKFGRVSRPMSTPS